MSEAHWIIAAVAVWLLAWPLGVLAVLAFARAAAEGDRREGRS